MCTSSGYKMAIRTGILFCTLFLGSLALPTPKEDGDMTQYFEYLEEPEDVQGRIIGGRVAPNGAHPWLVSLTHSNAVRSHFCGGSILSRRTVLTAAHCLWELRSGSTLSRGVRINAGTNRHNSGGQSIASGNFAIHPRYNHQRTLYDIAVVHTGANINIGGAVQRVNINWGNIGGGVGCRVAGWGSTVRLHSPASVQLMEVDLPTITNDRCNQELRRVGSRAIDTRIEMCALQGRGRGVCTGDSGGPLMANRRQIGIVSWTWNQCADGGPDVYVRVSAFRSWVEQNTRN